MAVEQVRPDQRPEKWFGSRRKILTSAQGLRFFPKPPAALLILLFQSHAMSEMRGCLSLDTHRGKHALNAEGAEHAQPLPGAERNLGRGPLAARTATIAPSHAGQHRALIEKPQPSRRHPANPGGIIRLPGRTRLHNVVALLLSRLDAALLSRPVQPPQRPTDGPGIDPHAGLS